MNATGGEETQQTKQQEIESRLLLKKLAYGQIFQGADSLLEDDYLFWTERLLLRLVRFLAGTRLEQLDDVLPARTEETSERQTKEALLDAAAEAALGGHELGEWTAVENGWQSVCSRCERTTWIGKNGLRYSLLADSCDSREA